MRNYIYKGFLIVIFLIIKSSLFGQTWEPGSRKGEISVKVWPFSFHTCNYDLRIKLNPEYNSSIKWDGDYAKINVANFSTLEFSYESMSGCLETRKINKVTVYKPNKSIDVLSPNSMNSNYFFNTSGIYFIVLDVESWQTDFKDKLLYHTIGIRVEVLNGKSFSSVNPSKICKGSTYNLSPNTLDNDYQYTYTWKLNNTIVSDDISTKVLNENYIAYDLDVYDKVKNVHFHYTKIIEALNRPQTPDRDPDKDLTDCGLVKLDCRDKGLINVSGGEYWHAYYTKIVKTGLLSWSKPNSNAKIYYGTSCEATKNVTYETIHSVTAPGTTTLYLAAKDSKTGCWSESCRPVTIELNDSKPGAPILIDQTACLCEHEDLTLNATTSDPVHTTSIRWYKADNVATPFEYGSSITVPREENIYLVSAYNNKNLCESEKVPVNVYTTPCNNCFGEFAPIPGKKYVLSAWVKESINTNSTYNSAAISISFDGSPLVKGPFKGKGPIVEGWQKIEEVFVIPADAVNIYLSLDNGPSSASDSPPVFFDDVRIHPFESNMVSYVYDPETNRLTATLDENNYATYYTYDLEGNLIAVNKETIDGIKTIQESRTVIKR